MRNDFKGYEGISLWREEEGDVIFFEYSPNSEIDLDRAKKLVETRLSYAGGKPSYYLIDLSNLKSVTKEAREYMSDPNGGLNGILAGAFISNKLLTTVIVNLFFQINRPVVPARFFTKKKDALEWLMKIKSNAV